MMRIRRSKPPTVHDCVFVCFLRHRPTRKNPIAISPGFKRQLISRARAMDELIKHGLQAYAAEELYGPPRFFDPEQ